MVVALFPGQTETLGHTIAWGPAHSGELSIERQWLQGNPQHAAMHSKVPYIMIAVHDTAETAK